MNSKKAIVLLSGGLDSATTLYIAKKQKFKCLCLIFDYGQRHRREIVSAKKIARSAGCKWQIVKISLPWKGSSLLDKSIAFTNDQPRLPSDTRGGQGLTTNDQAGIPNTYVPGRNIIFLSFALSCAEAIGAQAIFIGANAIDFSVAIDSKVIKKDDGLIPIQRCSIGDYILSMDRDTLKIRWSRVQGLIRHKYFSQIMYRIVTEHGREIIVSNGHSLFTLNDEGIIQPIKVDCIKKGDYILAPSKLKMFSNINSLNLLDLLANEEYLFIMHPKLGCLIKHYKNERERWWKRTNVMPLNIYNNLFRMHLKIKDDEILIKSRKDRERAIPAVMKLNKILSFFFGLWLAEGSYGKRGAVCISCGNEEATINFRDVCRIFSAKMSVRKNKIDKSMSSPLLMKIMKRLGFVGKARTKIVPPIIYDLPLELQAAFLRGFIIGDGSVSKDGAVGIYSASKPLINSIQDLLLNFNIIAYKKQNKHKKTNFYDKPSTIYCLMIENSIDKQFFLKFIGNINNKIRLSPTYRSRIRGIPPYKKLNDELKLCRTPVAITKIKNAIRNNGIYTENRFDRKLLLKLIPQTADRTLKEKWSSLVNNDLIFAKVEQKRRVPYINKYIYDVSVENNQNFVCDGVIAHNSGYPDCRPEFYRAFSHVIATGTKAGSERKKIAVETPLIHLGKAEIIKLGFSLGVPFEKTWSCYRGAGVPCGKCDSCFYRAKGFKEAGIRDPLLRSR
ncbi:MAG: 7-cyano-7-deazaguanine synthase [Candidatus Omnitrophica bacterium]|nr:7-cyano-7-deazaguanine synthase [Candidatus Omnitrophota bacterium]